MRDKFDIMIIMNFTLFLDMMLHQRHLAAIRKGMLATMPAFVTGSLALMCIHLPVAAFQQGMSLLFGSSWLVLCQVIVNISTQLMSLLSVITISYCLAQEHRAIRQGESQPLTASLLAFGCLMAWTQPVSLSANLTGISFTWTGLDGIFLAMLIAIATTEIFLALCSVEFITIKVFTDAVDPTLHQAFGAIVPAVLTLSLLFACRVAAGMIGMQDVHQAIYSCLIQVFAMVDAPLAKLLLLIFLSHLLWFFGFHGINILHPVLDQINVPAVHIIRSVDGLNGITAEALTKTFFEYALIGGSGSTLCLIIALFLASRRQNVSRLAKISILPGIFSINELLIFGLPIMYNPIYVIPFILVPATILCLTYLAIVSGLMPPISAGVNWNTPPFVSAYLSTGSWQGVAVQLFGVAIGTAIYYPFAKLNEKQQEAYLKQSFCKFLQEVEASAPETKKFLSRNDAIGNLARVLAVDLRAAIDRRELLLEYQPQVNSKHRVIGVEALLRWPHKRYGRIPPPLIIAVAEEAGLITALSKEILEEAARKKKLFDDEGLTHLRMSVNVSATQLEDSSFIATVANILSTNNIEPEEFEIEIIETVALSNTDKTQLTLEQLRTMGVRIAIDDFGMGHTSLRYLKEFPVDTLKIDGMLTRDVVTDKSCQGIIHSIVSLCESLNVETIVEFVETQEQQLILKQLNCLQYQGYLYSPALPAAQVTTFVRRLNKLALRGS